jgi:predicted alpha/beta hydrolase
MFNQVTHPLTQIEDLKIQCSDGVNLAATLVQASPARAAVLLSGGTGFRKEFYLNFAKYLAENGLTCLVFDYRGTAGSRAADMRNCDYDYLDYGQKDMPAMLDYLEERFPNLPKLLLGHSVGGQKAGFMPNLSQAKGLVCFATSVGYFAYMPWSYRLKALFFFYVFTPISVALTGYVAAKRFGFMEDLPRRVASTWRRLCSVRSYFFDPRIYGVSVPKGAFEDYPIPVQVFWATDDEISNARSVPEFWKHVKSHQPITFQELNPAAWGLEKIGHHGVFPKKFKDSLWPEVLQALERML